ncbi:MAG TPA: hypothetical protein VJR89_37580, partial [Polyangiales bacterium]|nr:hypothetical protein [Polyangiales bacterium]
EAALVGQTCGLTVVRLTARKQRGAAAMLVSELIHGLRQAAPVEAQRAAARRPHVLAELQRAPGELATSATDGEGRRQILSQVTDYVRDVARERPLLITVDDLDRADDFSTTLIAATAHQTRKSPHVVIASYTANTEQLPQGIATIAAIAHTLELKMLERRHNDLLVSSLFGDVPNLDRMSDWLYRVAHGNPKLTLELAEHLMTRGVVRYVGGIWVLPSDEIREVEPQSMAEAMMLRLSGSSPAALALAELCCVRRGGVSAEHCLALVKEPAEQVFRALEELVRAGVLESAGGEYVFAQEMLRKALQRSLSPERSQELHARWAERLLAQRPATQDTRLEAGWHLVHTREELRGADLLARIGPELVQKRIGLAAAIPALEKALDVYERLNRPRSARLRLRAMLVLCGYLFDYKLAARYGQQTLDELYECAGLSDISRWTQRLGGGLGFLVGAFVANLRWMFSSFHGRGPNVVASLVYYLRSAMGLLGVRAVALDVEGTRAIHERIALLADAPLPVLRLLNRMACAVTQQNQGREGEAFVTVQSAIEQMNKPPLGATRQEHADLLSGALLLAGIIESYREHSKALEYARRLEALGTPLSISAAQRVFITYYLLRGDRERTQHYRRLLDLHAIQGSTTWQVEWFAVPLEGMAGATWTDLIMLRRALDRLEQLVQEVPSLAPMRDSIRVSYHFRRGDYAQAAALGTAYVAQHPPRSIIGWAPAYAIAALALVEIDQPEQALALTERALAAVSDEDRSYFVFYAPLEAAHATALAVLGYRERADEIFRVRLARLKACGEHMRAFIIHEYRTKVARLIGDREALIAAIKDMREAALASGNPTVIALADRVT